MVTSRTSTVCCKIAERVSRVPTQDPGNIIIFCLKRAFGAQKSAVLGCFINAISKASFGKPCYIFTYMKIHG